MTAYLSQSLYRKHWKFTLATVSTTAIAALQHTTASTPLTLSKTSFSDGATAKIGHQLTLTSASSNDFSGVNFTFVGVDPDGLAITETIAGPNASTVTTTNYYYSITSITPDTTDGTHNLSAGFAATAATQRIPIEPQTGSFNVGCGVTISGTASVSMQCTMDDIYDSSVTPVYIADTTLATKSSTFYSALGVVVSAVRFITNSYSTGAIVTFHVIQNRPGY